MNIEMFWYHMIMNYPSRPKYRYSRLQHLSVFSLIVVALLLLSYLTHTSVFTVFSHMSESRFGITGFWQTMYTDKAILLRENVKLQKQVMVLKQQTQSGLSDSSSDMALWDNGLHATAVLSRPPQSAYDTYILSSGTNDGLAMKQVVVAQGKYVIGYIDQLTGPYARARLFSSAGDRVTVSIDGLLFHGIGEGGGIISVRLPRNFADTGGQVVRLPGIPELIMGTIVLTEFNPQDSYVQGIISLPVNIYAQEVVVVVDDVWEDVDATSLDSFSNNDESDFSTQ